jgi:hypothetical protein
MDTVKFAPGAFMDEDAWPYSLEDVWTTCPAALMYV